VKAVQPIPSELPPVVGQLIRVVGHDLRNKLAVMKNSLYYLNMRLGHGDEKVQKHLRIMGREVANANRIIADLMDFALLKQPSREQSDVKAIVAEALSQASLPDRWEATIRLDDGLPPLMADVLQLQRAFTNIILRIVEGMPEGGKLQIAAREQGGFVEVEFGAAGFIIPEENLAEIFNPLISAGGTNLGMAVSKRLVEGHRGTIEERSLAGPFDKLRTGKGKAFMVRLPLR
jgi:signal transduction histidine kinase